MLSTLAISSPTATNGSFWTKKPPIDGEGLECFQEGNFQFVSATDTAAIAINNNHVGGDQGHTLLSIGAPDSRQANLANGGYYEDG